MHLSGFFKCFCMSEVFFTFNVLMLFVCVILHIMLWVKSLQLLCILPFGMLCLTSV